MEEDRRIVDEKEFLENLVDDRPGKPAGSPHQFNFSYSSKKGCFTPRSLLVDLGVYAVVLMVTSGLFPGGFYLDGIGGALAAALLMTVLNIILKPIIILLTLPLTLMTFGVFYIFINGFILWVASLLMGDAFIIRSFFTAVTASIVISLLRLGIDRYILKDKRIKIG